MNNVTNDVTKSNRFRNILIGVLVFLMIIVGYQSRKLSKANTNINIAEQNQKALTDSVRISKNKLGDLEFSKNILVSEKGDLSKLNKDLFDELQKENGKVSELTKFIATIKNKPSDTIRIPNSLVTYPDGTKGLPWSYEKHFDKDNYRLISGVSDFKINFTSATYEVIPLTTKITKDEIGFNIIQGLRERDGNVEMFVRSDYPDFSVKDLNSVIINPETHPVLKKFTQESKQKRFGIGIYSGYGVYIDNSNNTAGFGAQVGFGLTYSLFNF